MKIVHSHKGESKPQLSRLQEDVEALIWTPVIMFNEYNIHVRTLIYFNEVEKKEKCTEPVKKSIRIWLNAKLV